MNTQVHAKPTGTNVVSTLRSALVSSASGERRGDDYDLAQVIVGQDINIHCARVAMAEAQQQTEYQRRCQKGIGEKCKDCGKDIPSARRAAMPNTVWCVDCKPKHDVKIERRK